MRQKSERYQGAAERTIKDIKLCEEKAARMRQQPRPDINPRVFCKKYLKIAPAKGLG